jgi:acyl carrier protein
VIVGVEEMPLTASGKIDRRALPKVSRERSATPDHSFVAPHSEIERMIADVWREVLSVERVGVNDNFFDLGGHSLLVIEVRNKLHERAGQQLSVIELFQYPTIDALAKYLSQKQSATLSLQKIQQRAEKQKEALHRQRQLAKQRARVNG